MNYIATPILINVLKDAVPRYMDGKMNLLYDTDNIMLDVMIDEDNILECEMWIGEKKIKLKQPQKDLIVNFTHGLLIDEIEEQREFNSNKDEHLNY